MRRKSGIGVELFQILLSLGIICASIFLILDWKQYDFCFWIVFGLGVVLSFTRGVCAVRSDSRKMAKFGLAALCFLGTAIMTGMLVGSVLTTWFL